MKLKGVLPVPFLILILAGIASIFNVFADRAPRVAVTGGNSLQMQTVEQERMVDSYFRVLSWLSDVIPRAANPAKVNPSSGPAPQPLKASPPCGRQGRVELCAFPSSKSVAVYQRRVPSMN